MRRMPGSLARVYAEAGGPVWLAGKPAPVIYEAALRELGLPAHDVVAIGDSAEHDIAGAQRAGVASLFVAGGIHAGELGLGKAPALEASAIEAWFARRLDGEGAAQAPPTYSTDYLRW